MKCVFCHELLHNADVYHKSCYTKRWWKIFSKLVTDDSVEYDTVDRVAEWTTDAVDAGVKHMLGW